MEEQQLDVDDSDILPMLLHSSRPQPPQKPTFISPPRLTMEEEEEEQLDINDDDIRRPSAPKAPAHPLPVTGTSRSNNSQGSRPASLIFSRLQRPSMQACTQRPSRNVTTRVNDLSSNPSSTASSKRTRICDETDDCIQVFPAPNLSTSKTRGFSGADIRPCHEKFISPLTNSQAGKEHQQEQSSAEARQDDNHGSQCHRNVSSLPYAIPGPAGAVQLAMRQKTSLPPHASTSKSKISAADRSSRMAVEDDADFKSRSWLDAMEYLRQTVEIIPNISSVKSSRTENRVRKLVGIVKACAPNGCSDVFATLKDLSGTIGGTVNRNVMTETEFGRDIEPGAVILLHEVAVFSPMPYAHYLNVTMNNVEQVYILQTSLQLIVP